MSDQERAADAAASPIPAEQADRADWARREMRDLAGTALGALIATRMPGATSVDGEGDGDRDGDGAPPTDGTTQTATITLSVNGRVVRLELDPRTSRYCSPSSSVRWWSWTPKKQ